MEYMKLGQRMRIVSTLLSEMLYITRKYIQANLIHLTISFPAHGSHESSPWERKLNIAPIEIEVRPGKKYSQDLSSPILSMP